MREGDFDLLSEYIDDVKFHDWATSAGIGYNVSFLLSDRTKEYWFAGDEEFKLLGFLNANGQKPGVFIHTMLAVRNTTIEGLNRYFLAYLNDLSPRSTEAFQLYRETVE